MIVCDQCHKNSHNCSIYEAVISKKSADKPGRPPFLVRIPATLCDACLRGTAKKLERMFAGKV